MYKPGLWVCLFIVVLLDELPSYVWLGTNHTETNLTRSSVYLPPCRNHSVHDVNVLSVRYEAPHNCSLTLSRPITDLITTHQWPHPNPISSNSLSFVSKIMQSVRITCFFSYCRFTQKMKKKSFQNVYCEKLTYCYCRGSSNSRMCLYPLVWLVRLSRHMRY